MNDISDEFLIKNFQKGNIKSYNQLVYRYKDRLFNYIYQFVSLNNYLKTRKTFLITSKNNFNKTLAFRKLGYKIILINKLEDRSDFNLLFKKIYKKGYSRVFVETGLTFLNSLIKNKMIHDLYVFKSNIKLGNSGKNNDTVKNLKKINPKLLTINLNGDKLLKKEFYYV